MARYIFRIGLALVLVLLFNAMPLVPGIGGEIVLQEPRGTRGTIVVNASGGGDYTRIQWAIDNASDGDVIFVEAGIYYGYVYINKSITLIGVGWEKTIINGNGNEVIIISANWVNISGFTFINSGGYPGAPNIRNAGIKLWQSDNCTIRDNKCAMNQVGIYLYNSNSNTISDNRIVNNSDYGVKIDTYTVQINQSNRNRIFKNIFINNNHGEVQGYDRLSNNIWNNTYDRGNYWCDYESRYPNASKTDFKWNTPYKIDSHTSVNHSSCDFHPRTEEFVYDKKFPISIPGSDITIKQHEIAFFNGSHSHDDYGIINYTWWFRCNDTKYHMYGPTPSFRFHIAGSYTVWLMVTNEHWDSSSNYLCVCVLDIEPPHPNAGPDEMINQSVCFTFDSNESWDNTGIVNYTWIFSLNNTNIFLYGKSPNFTFNLPGRYNITLNATDVEGNWATDTMILIVLDSTRPTALAGHDIHLDQHMNSDFNASGSYDNIAIMNYTWSFQYRNKHILLFDMAASFRFHDAGKYVITLNVTDAEGNWDTDTLNVTVLDITPPKANAVPDITINQSDTVEFFFHQHSTDNVGIENWMWIFEYNGTQEILSHSIIMSSLPLFKFEIPGIYTVTMNVTDEVGNWAIDTLNVTVLDTISPHADAGNGQEIDGGTSYRFNGTGSWDNVGIVNYTWTFEYDGETVTLFNPSPEFRFIIPGEYNIELVVTDAVGNSATNRMYITVTPKDDDIGPIDNDDEEEDRGHSGTVWIWLSLAVFGIAVVVVLLLFFRKRKDVSDEVSGEDELGRVGKDDDTGDNG